MKPSHLQRSSTIFAKLDPKLKLPHSKSVPFVFASSNVPLPRELPTRHGEEWRWLNVVGFWIGACFAIGSMMFVIGSGVSTFRPLFEEMGFSKWKRRALVDYSYAIGGCYFTAGAYLSYYEVINVGKKHHRWFAGPGTSMSVAGYWGSLSYFIGAASFQIAVTAVFIAPELPAQKVLTLEWIPQAIGGALFTTAACIESWHNQSARATQYVYWVCLFYLIGSILFLVAAAMGTWLYVKHNEDEFLVQSTVDLPYLVGSLCFLIGAWAQLLMWKAEQFGLGFLSEINEDFVPEHDSSKSPKAEAEPQQQAPGSISSSADAPVTSRLHQADGSHFVDQCFLAVYLVNGALSALNFSLSYVWHVYTSFEMYSDRAEHVEALLETEELISDLTAFIAAHSMLLLATAVHFTPTLQPYGYLLWLLRGISMLFLCAGTLRCIKYMEEAVPTAMRCKAIEAAVHHKIDQAVQEVMSAK